MIIMANVLLKPKVAVAIDMPITPYIATGLRPYRSDAYVHGTTMRVMRGESEIIAKNALVTTLSIANIDWMVPE